MSLSVSGEVSGGSGEPSMEASLLCAGVFIPMYLQLASRILEIKNSFVIRFGR